jgi:hypothetical protein
MTMCMACGKRHGYGKDNCQCQAKRDERCKQEGHAPERYQAAAGVMWWCPKCGRSFREKP